MPAGGAIVVGVLTWELYYLHDILFIRLMLFVPELT